MKRIAIVGCPGAGKSTLAVQLRTVLNLEVIHLDAYFWKPGWVETPQQEWVEIHDELIEKSEWIMDGNYARTSMHRFVAADTVIFLDYSRWLCLWRGFKRVIRYHGRTRPDLAVGCPEKFDWEFEKWIWRFPKNDRIRIVETIKGFQDIRTIFWFRKPGETKKFLKDLIREST